MNQKLDKAKMNVPASQEGCQADVEVGYDRALSSLLKMVDDIDPITAGELRERLGLGEEDSCSTSNT